MKRFSIDNRCKDVSLRQFKDTGKELEASLKEVRPDIYSILLCTTDEEDYKGWGSHTELRPEVIEAGNRREQYQLQDLDHALWQRSFETGLYLKVPDERDTYMVTLTVEAREPKRMFFYAQQLDDPSMEVFGSFRRCTKMQDIGDGFPKASDFSAALALSRAKNSYGSKRSFQFF